MTFSVRSELREEVRNILGRMDADDLQELLPAIAGLLNRHGFEHWWTRPQVYRAFEQEGLHITRNHFYSPLPDTALAARHLARQVPLTAASHMLSASAFADTWGDIRSFAHELADLPRESDNGFHWDNNMFPNLDAIIYYCMLRRNRPRRIIEIGSGFSTHIARRALERNGMGRLHVVEPYPTAKLRELLGRLDEMYEAKIQDVPSDLFAQLEDGDVLFVDSSHVCKTGSDLNHILFEILPALRASVLMHFHDIFLPHEYPADWVVGRGYGWNEQYLLLAFLMGNAAVSPLVGSALMAHSHQAML
ncbi:MAG TPA: class I SAM-dependent methyltransferase, partial [Acetobacteraceae bacterium]|nr:class I SAM-dependent methyltransferase [Acetobacteraceae bacterium]